MIAERALQHGAQARERRNGREGIAVGLNNTGIGIRLQEASSPERWAGDLSTHCTRTAPLQMQGSGDGSDTPVGGRRGRPRPRTSGPGRW